ncbi:MAG: sigma-70 family RNA polymerase sigma factor [Clostridia bacterium]|nr:sigma-70 family RNA polymerase sigma factor [Clostridia bacterium]
MQEDINSLFIRYKQTGDVALRNQIAEKYLYIADILAKKFVGRGVEYDDLKQVASLALLKGIERFDPNLGMQFSTFITPTITGEIKNYFRDKSRLIKLPRRLNETAVKVRKYSAEYLGEKGVKPTAKEIAAALRIPEDEVIQALEISGTVSLDTLATDDDTRSLHDVIADENDGFEKLETKDALRSAMKDFDDVEKRLIKYRFVDELSQAETAEKLGVSQMFVSRTERKLLARMREKLKESI